MHKRLDPEEIAEAAVQYEMFEASPAYQEALTDWMSEAELHFQFSAAYEDAFDAWLAEQPTGGE